LFVGTIRSEAVQPGEPLAQLTTALIREQLVEQLELAPLDKAATDQLVFLLAGGPVSSEMSASVYAATDGNPLFVEQLVLALRDDGRLTGRVGPTQQIVADISNVPVVVRELIEERLRRLSARARTTLEAAAVLGDTFNYGDLLAVLAPEDEATLLTDLDEAIQGQLLRERPTGFAFGHSLMRDGIYWGLSRPRRMLLHGRTASVLEQRAGAHAPDMAAELAHHFASAGRARPAQERALRYSLRAGRESAALASNREALHHFEIACEVIDRGAVDVDNSTRISALEGRGNAERSTGIWARCIATFRAVLELATDPVTRATAHQILSFALQHVGDTAAALAEAEKGLAAAAAEPDPHQAAIARIKLQSQLAMLWFLRGRFEDLLQLGNEMVELAQQVDEPRWLAWAQYVPCWAHTGSGRTRLAIEHYALQLASAEAGGDKLDVAGAHTNLGLEFYRAGRFAESERHLEQGVAMYRDSFSELRAVLALQGLGWTHLAQGRIGRAQEYADISMALAAEARDRWLADCLELSGALDMLHASWDSAEDCLAQALEIRQRVGHVASTVDTLLRLGRLSEYRAQDDRADDFFDRAVRIADTMDPAPCVVNAHLCRGVRLLRHGDVAAGAVDIEHARHLAESMQESLVDAAVLLAMAELHQQRGDLSAALSAAERALAAPHTAEFSVDAHLRFAALLSAAGRHDKGRVQTAAAIRVATELGAEHLLPLQRRPA
ncbi:MAG TPA: tetratricopeptide repeat protein, partial [Chloroflexota bacterium]|nr:tetratricopeptide repeat protein [Chloroflexota bacterium]